MKISGINSLSVNSMSAIKSFKAEKKSTDDLLNGVNGQKLILKGNVSKYFDVVANLSNQKVGSKFVIQPKNPKYSELKLLITPETKLYSSDFEISVGKETPKKPSFNGRLYGSIRRDDNDKVDYKMQDEYAKFWTEGMYPVVARTYRDRNYANYLVKDYNFFIPSDGDGTRYKDITSLQGGKTKPASDIPAYMNDKQMSLVQGVISNFARTGKLTDMFEFIRVKPAQGSAFAFLEGLKNGQISPDKPIVFSWGDNFSDINISRLMYNHETSDAGFTVTVLPVDKVRTKSLSVVKPSSFEERTIEKFVEKPQDDTFIESCVQKQLGKNKCLAAVGPYILSPEALHWIKDNYTKSPDKFLNPDKGYDFSSMIIAPMLEAFNDGKIVSANGKPLTMKFDTILNAETWSDLGSQKDFSQAMKDIKLGKYQYLPYEMRTSMRKNVDDFGNITFNNTSFKLLKSLLSEFNISASNVIAYCKDDGLGYNKFDEYNC